MGDNEGCTSPSAHRESRSNEMNRGVRSQPEMQCTSNPASPAAATKPLPVTSRARARRVLHFTRQDIVETTTQRRKVHNNTTDPPCYSMVRPRFCRRDATGACQSRAARLTFPEIVEEQQQVVLCKFGEVPALQQTSNTSQTCIKR